MQQAMLDRRDLPRMLLDCTARCTSKAGGQPEEVQVRDLSGSGMYMWCNVEHAPGTELSVVITPLNPITPPLTAVVEVNRVEVLEEEPRAFAVACRIKAFIEPDQA